MELYLVRHAIAEPGAAGLSDERRALTAHGRERFGRCVAGLQRLGISVERLLHSPLLRAVETAELMAPLLEGESIVTTLLAEAPTLGLLRQFAGVASAAAVGHEPWMTDLVNRLLFDEQASAPLVFKKGAVAWLRGEPVPGGMQLVAFLPPRVLVELT